MWSYYTQNSFAWSKTFRIWEAFLVKNNLLHETRTRKNKYGQNRFERMNTEKTFWRERCFLDIYCKMCNNYAIVRHFMIVCETKRTLVTNEVAFYLQNKLGVHVMCHHVSSCRTDQKQQMKNIDRNWNLCENQKKSRK